MAGHRVILHADMDAFYAAVEQRDDPKLQGRAVAVGGAAPRGVVAAASYEARRFGVHSAMPTARALRACPELVVLSPRMSYYAQISQRVFAILREISPLIEPLSLDEAFVDLTGTEKLHGPAEQVGRRVKARVRDELRLVVSIGIGPNKFVAKVASDVGKPDGLVIVPADGVEAFLHPLPVRRLWGVGKVAERRLARLGISTIADMAALPQAVLVAELGQHGKRLWELARGVDERAVEVQREAKSIGQEDTFDRDVDSLAELSRHVREQADRVAHRLRHEGLIARVVVLKVKTADFKLRTRRRTLSRATSDGTQLGHAACELLAKLKPNIGAVRLTGVAAAGLTFGQAPRQLSLEDVELQRGDRLGEVMDRISEKFGAGSILRGRPPDDAHRRRGGS